MNNYLKILLLAVALTSTFSSAVEVRYFAFGKCAVKFDKMKKIKGIIAANDNLETCCQITQSSKKTIACYTEDKYSSAINKSELKELTRKNVNHHELNDNFHVDYADENEQNNNDLEII